MAWRRLGSVALQVVRASATAAAQREAAEQKSDVAAKPRERNPTDGPVLFSRVAVISGPVSDSPSVSAAA